MIGFDEALALVLAEARPLGTERVAIADAAGRVVAEPVTARRDSPAADASVMDGYAVRSADLPGRLRLVGRSYPGGKSDRPVGAGEAVRIFTGAPLPAGADRVVIQEAVQADADWVEAGAPAGPAFVRARGSDFRAGDVLLDPGERLHARRLVAAAAADRGELAVFRRPRVAILGTGDELAPPGHAGTQGRLPDSITLALAALVGEAGATVADRALLGDDPDLIAAHARAAVAAADLVVVTGGASVGERDHARRAFAAAGLTLAFAKVAMKPGKPVWFGRAGNALVLGLPGNPGSAMVTARLFMLPLLAGLGGDAAGAQLAWRDEPLATAIPANGNRETFLRAAYSGDGAAPFANQDSGSQRVIAAADLLIRRPIGAPALAAGASVPVIDL